MRRDRRATRLRVRRASGAAFARHSSHSPTGIAVGDDATAEAEPDPIVGDLEGSDRDAQLELVGRAGEADRTAVRLTGGLLEPVAQRHSGDLRSAGDRTGRKAGTDQVGIPRWRRQGATRSSTRGATHRRATQVEGGSAPAPTRARLTRPRSLRTRSTIITCSARSFSAVRRSASPSSVCGLVPLIGREVDLAIRIGSRTPRARGWRRPRGRRATNAARAGRRRPPAWHHMASGDPVKVASSRRQTFAW